MDRDDPVQIPLTFPIQDVGEPTPGTTNLEEPPSGIPPRPRVSTQPWATQWEIPEESSLEGTPPPIFKDWVKAQHMNNSIRRNLNIVRNEQEKLDSFICKRIES